MEQSYENKIAEALTSTEDVAEEESLITLTSGVQLKYKRVPVLRIQAIVNKFKYPPIPETWDEVKGRAYKNPQLPEYLEARQQVDVDKVLAVIDAIAAVGTELHFKPDSVPSVDDDSWLEELEVMGIEVNVSSKIARYLAWVRYVAVVDQDDFMRIAQKAGLAVGTSEERVASALQGSFQDH